MSKRRERISGFREWRVLARQARRILFSDKKNLLVSLIFPVCAALITVWIAGENMFVHYEGTKSACFVLVSAAIWCGLFNSIQIVVRERANIKRDYTAGLRLRCYTASRAELQLVLCLIQSALLTAAFLGVEKKFGNTLPGQGLILENPLLECYVSIFLLMFAADATGLLVSCLVRKTETANVLAPYILIVQLIFSGILFPMKDQAETVSYAMLSRWGMEALGSTCLLNDLPLKIQATVPTVPHEAEDMFLSTAQHLQDVWVILGAFALGCIFLGNLALHRVARDTR
ncbi:MAG: ABC transporter permease [Ruminiclostridium sp.]|nr:ABC transporter permease [Ruminiclostridium sp.]